MSPSPTRRRSARSPSRQRPRSSRPLPSKTELASQREVFLAQAEHCEPRSPLYAELCRRFADDPVAGEIVGPDMTWEQPLRLLGGLHYLVLAGEASWDDPLEEHREFLAEFVRTQGVQTNEVQRSWVLLPLFLRVAERTGADELDLIELGSSAGLNLVWDRYRYVYGAAEWGAPDAPLTLAAEEKKPVPAELLDLRPEVRGRVGIDRNPIDVTTDQGARLLKSFVWAGQTKRLERLDRAIEALRTDPPELIQGDIVETLPAVLAERRPNALTVVFETATLGYLPEGGVERVRSALDEAGEAGNLAFVATGRGRTGDKHWGLRIAYYPGAEREFAGEADYHGAWLDWWL
ncbi:MAG TPA: DUF2332 domain-containing protein [Gaiellaceae bacterium]|nr:DUF2332 domain-containing protein [Gaiellaceae bacterium]